MEVVACEGAGSGSGSTEAVSSKRRVVTVVAVSAVLGLGGLVVLGLTQSPDDVVGWFTEERPPPRISVPPPVFAPEPAPVPPPAPPPVVVVQPPPPPPVVELSHERTACRGLTWTVRAQTGMTVWVGTKHGQSNPYAGDLSCAETAPLLCFKPRALPKPVKLTEALDGRWSGGEVALLPGVMGAELRSREQADGWCKTKFGKGWRMAEFHDGGGWGFQAQGELPRDARFWVAINDQRANSWDR